MSDWWGDYDPNQPPPGPSWLEVKITALAQAVSRWVADHLKR